MFAKSMVEVLVELGGQEDGNAAELMGEYLGDLVLVGRVNLGTQGPNVDDVRRGREGTTGEPGTELKSEGVEVPGEGPVAGDGVMSGAKGEMVVYDDASLLHRRGGERTAGDGR